MVLIMIESTPVMSMDWMWMDVDGYPFSSTYQKVVYGFPRWFREHV